MKLNLAVCLLAISVFAHALLAMAQAAPPAASIYLSVAATSAACAWPAGATFTNAMALCPVSTGVGTATLYYALNGASTFVPLIPTQGATGVASFNGRTGAVTLVTSDVTATGITAKTSSTTTLQ